MFARIARAVALAAAALAAAPSAVAAEVVVASRSPGYYTSLAKHAQRWLSGEGVKSELVKPDGMAAAFKDAKIAFLVGFDEVSADEYKAISDFRAGGGRLVVFYSSSPRLAALMGVKLLGYTKASYPGQWSRMDFSAKYPEGCPKSILQTSTVLQRAEAIPGRTRVMATWSDRTGKTTGDAAWLSGAAGYWMTHVLLADGDEALKAQLLGSLVGSVAPRQWSYGKFKARKASDERFFRELAGKQTKRTGEIHAVWEHSGCGLYPGDWPATFRLLRKSGVTDLFVNVAGAGFAHYPSGVLPQSKTYSQEGDQLAACLAAAKGSGVRVHAWVICFSATRSSPETIADFRRRGWMLKSRDGADSEYLDPSNPAVRRRILSAIAEIQSKYRVDGVHLDFVRWYERAAKPADAVAMVTRFVAEARLKVRRPAWLTTAVLGKYPACVDSVGQDWPGWIDSGIVDYVVPMDYTEDMAKFEQFVDQHAESKARARKTIVGIGVTANESRLTLPEVINQMRVARRRDVAGFALFDLDTTLEKQFLPYLKMGMW